MPYYAEMASYAEELEEVTGLGKQGCNRLMNMLRETTTVPFELLFCVLIASFKRSMTEGGAAESLEADEKIELLCAVIKMFESVFNVPISTESGKEAEAALAPVKDIMCNIDRELLATDDLEQLETDLMWFTLVALNHRQYYNKPITDAMYEWLFKPAHRTSDSLLLSGIVNKVAANRMFTGTSKFTKSSISLSFLLNDIVGIERGKPTQDATEDLCTFIFEEMNRTRIAIVCFLCIVKRGCLISSPPPNLLKVVRILL